MRLFPAWATELGLRDVRLVGCDLPIHAERERYREIVEQIRIGKRERGALVTTHKISLFEACRDLFDGVDEYAALCGETSCLAKRNGRLYAWATDPISSGRALAEFYPTAGDSEVLCLGGGGSAVAITVHLLKHSTRSRITVVNRTAGRLEAMRAIHSQLAPAAEVRYVENSDPRTNDRLIGDLPPRSLVINATGMVVLPGLIDLHESLTEVENSKERFGRRPTEVAYDAGLLGRRTIAAHCVWLSDTEIALMRETGTQISHNPSSNAKLGNGIARLPEMLAAGLNVGLGHDAAECNNSLDMFEVMKFASLMHRAARVDASLQQAPDVLGMATRNGAAALGHETGQLAAGYKADVSLVDTRNVMFTPLAQGNAEQLYSHLVFAANGSAVDTTIVDGRVLMRGRQLLTLDEQEILRQANAAFQRVLARI